MKNELQELTDEVLRVIEESENWITKDNLEDKITEALEHPINHNFSIRRNGLIHSRSLSY